MAEEIIPQIITDILKAEGWDKYTDHPADRGGPTKWGITQKSWGDYCGGPVLPRDVQLITEDQARAFYRHEYIEGPGYDRIESSFLIGCVTDAAVNHGTRRATEWLQRAVGAKQDGVLGPMTLQATKGQDDTTTALKFLSYRVQFYGRLVTRQPSQAVFARGWNNRVAKWLRRLADYHTGG